MIQLPPPVLNVLRTIVPPITLRNYSWLCAAIEPGLGVCDANALPTLSCLASSVLLKHFLAIISPAIFLNVIKILLIETGESIQIDITRPSNALLSANKGSVLGSIYGPLSPT